MRTIPVLFLIMLLGIGACTRITPTNPDPRGILRFTGEPEQAHIEIDDTSLGPLSMFQKDGVWLRPGKHRIVIRAEGFFTEYELVEIRVGKTTILKIGLRKIPD